MVIGMNGEGKEITCRERLLTALAHKEPDRVPFDLGSTKITGISFTAYKNLIEYKGWNNSDPQHEVSDTVQQLAKVREDVLQRLGVDVRGLIPSSPSQWAPEYKDGGEHIQFTDEWGITWRKPKNGGFYFDMVNHPLAGSIESSDLVKFKWPDPLDDTRTSGFIEQISRFRSQGDYGLTLHGVCAGLMEMALRLRGFENFFVDLALEPDLACNMLDRITEIKIAYWDKTLEQVGNDIAVAVEADDLGTQDSFLISADMYRKYIKPRHYRIFSFIKKKAPHVKVFLHSCGAILPLIHDLIEAGVDILNPVQVSAKDMNTKVLKKEFGKDITFWGGGIDTQKVLPYGSPDEVRDEVRRRIDDLAPGGGFVFNTVHNIQADVPPRNIEAMVNALQEYGHYR